MLQHMTALRSEHRYSSMGQVIEALQVVLDSDPNARAAGRDGAR